MFEPIRGGTRGGQAEFKWSDVGADKDRENYLGHSINAPTGRWQKGKDVHWYNRDMKDEEDSRAEEIRKIKEAEAEALSAALGFAPDPNSIKIGAGPSVPTASKPKEDEDRAVEKEEKKRKKAERKEEKRAKKEQRRLERSERHAVEDGKRHSSRYDDRGYRRARSRSRSPRLRSREQHTRERDYSSRRPRSESLTPPPSRLTRDYDIDERERERERDRRRWDRNTERDRPSGGGLGRYH
ncbi:hypothetical protein AAF712_009383 [Marasmius tenuissimus]|uniref:Multiple myeloma tumor-associated protein 2-like N-terminal domain-containing protein n=1 Tax=Marasmius tenuissimus TaxID=585030 RepID=A0ABR2ZRH8_9AGAR